MKAPFNVPAINNEFEILAKILGIADDNDQERSKIGAFGKQGGVSKFKYSGEVYSVASKSKLPGVKTSYEFNGNWYSIQKEGCANHSAEIQDRLDDLEMSVNGDETDDDTRADILDEIAELEARLEDLAA